MGGFAEALRTGSWLTRERMRLVAIALLTASVLGALFLIATSDGLNDRLGRPLGTDFANVYAAGTYVLEHRAAAPFDPALQFAREQALFGPATQFYGWHYPPFFLALAGLLSLMPYALALALWQAVTLVFYALTMLSILSSSSAGGRGGERALGHDGLVILLAFAFPAVFVNLGHGHNGFLTAALFGGALWQLERRPVVAGILFGLLAYKPQFALLIPIVLAASGRWRAFAAAAVTLLALIGMVTLAFGTDVWRSFFASMTFTREVVLERGDTGWHKIQSVFSWVRMWGGGVELAYAAQGAATVAVGVALVWLWRGRAPFAWKAAALSIGTILATPYSLDYDLMLLAPAIAFLVADGAQRGFAPWEKTALAVLWLLPLVTRSVAQWTLIPLAVPAMIAMFLLLLHGAAASRSTTAHWRSPASLLK